MRNKHNAKTSLTLLDLVALLKDVPDEKLAKGQVGTIVEKLDANVYEIEFSDKNGTDNYQSGFEGRRSDIVEIRSGSGVVKELPIAIQ